jgi:transcriptional antiterminator RfaH
MSVMAENENPKCSPHSNESAQWFCVKSQPKHEHIAAEHLRQFSEIEVFLPRIRFKRVTRQGAAWATEALFPGYLFARFNWQSKLRQVHHARGVRGVVHFGDRWPAIPEYTIVELRRCLGDADLHTINTPLAPGDTVQVAEGTLQGLKAVVTRIVPGRERVAVLMEFLGQQTMIELPINAIVVVCDMRRGIVNRNSSE